MNSTLCIIFIYVKKKMLKPHWKEGFVSFWGWFKGGIVVLTRTVVWQWWYGVQVFSLSTLSFSLLGFCLIFSSFSFLSCSLFLPLLLGSQHFTLSFFGFWFSLLFFPFLPFSSNSYYGSLLSAQSLLFFSLFLTWYFLSKLAHIVSCFTPIFMSNDEAFGTFLGAMFVAISSFGSISTPHHNCTFWPNMIVLPSLH